MTYADNLNYLDANFEDDDNRSAAALNTLLSAFGSKYTNLNCVEVRVADHPANMRRQSTSSMRWMTVTVLDDGIYTVHSDGNRKSFTFEQADDIYDYAESLCLEEVEELN